MTTIGFIGSGNIGSQVARAAIATGHEVVMSNSRGAETLSELIAELGPHARAASPVEAAAAGDFVVVSVPVKAIDDVPVAPLDGKIVLDTNNYYPQRDGQVAELDAGRITVSGLLQRHLPGSQVVKAFNHIRAAEITSDATPSGTPGRRALAIAGDDEEARALVADFIDGIGFDVVDLGPLSESWRIEAGTPGYGAVLTQAELAAATANAERPIAS
ncbi:NADPH-dependent F420 reductase [Lysinimonas soli]|uniref:NADPH-dependent F420 reductase n=1 Tax=Lysinimonas soli TaxID=1074233 RepID=A0ABW0NKN1_9MICO